MSDDNGYVVGRIKWYSDEKGYGFIQLPGGGVDIFVHANQLKKSNIMRPLLEGEKVRFVTAKGPKGAFATDVTIVSEGAK